MTSSWVTLVVGLAVLLVGRRLFWLFVGAAGFAVGLHVAPTAFANSPEWLILVAALVLGIVGAVLAIVFQWLAVGLGGFVAGVHGGLAAAGALGLQGTWLWAAAVAAGIVVAALVLWLMDPVLILLSALIGAALLAPLVPVSAGVRPWIFVGLVIVGIFVQASVLAPPEGESRAPRRRTA
jgi:Domain of unknown function (DUF4203)